MHRTKIRSVRMLEWMALLTLDQGASGLRHAGDAIASSAKRLITAHSPSYAPPHTHHPTTYTTTNRHRPVLIWLEV